MSSILSHKLRLFLALLGVIFDVATVIVVVSLIEGFNTYVDEKIANIGTNAFAVQKYSIEDFSSVEALNAARRRNSEVTLEDLKALRAAGGRSRRSTETSVAAPFISLAPLRALRRRKIVRFLLTRLSPLASLTCAGRVLSSQFFHAHRL